MQALPENLQALLITHVQRYGSGFAISHQSLTCLWTAIGESNKVPEWRRLSRFVQNTASKFLIEQGDDDAEPDQLYHAEVLSLLFLDLLGISVGPPELKEYLQTHLSPENISEHTQDLDTFSDTGEQDDVVELRHSSSLDLDTSTTDDVIQINRRKRVRIEQCLKHGELLSEQASEDLDVPTLISILHSKNNEIARLRADKRKLQQGLRRANSKIQKQSEDHEQKLESLRKKYDFDIERHDQQWESSEKKWSWLTPLGQVNVAVTCELLVIFTCGN